MIKKLGKGKYEVVSKSGKNLGKTVSRKKAAKRLGQVEYFKHHKESQRPAKAPAGSYRVRECDCLEAIAVSEDEPVIKGVKVISYESKNRRRYTPESIDDAMYEGLLVNIDHTTGSRSSYDRFGRLRNISRDETGLRGDLHYNPHHPLANAVKWAAQHDPGQYGLSHDAFAKGQTRDGVFVVEKVLSLKSVDVVADAATTRGLLETMDPETTTEVDTTSGGDESPETLADHVSSAVSALIKDKDCPLDEKMRKIKKALEILEEPQEEETEEDEEEDLDEEDDEEPVKKKTEESVKQRRGNSKDPEMRALREELDTLKTERAAEKRLQEAQQACKDAKLPDYAVTEVFLEKLCEAKDAKAMKRLIEDRRAVVSVQRPRSYSGGSGTGKGGNGKTVDVKTFARQVKEGR